MLIDNNYCTDIRILIDFCILLCPVSDPYARFRYLETSEHPKQSEMISDQLKFFGSERNMRYESKYLNRFTTQVQLLYVADMSDINVPGPCNHKLNKVTEPLMYEAGYDIIYKQIDGIDQIICGFILNVRYTRDLSRPQELTPKNIKYT